MKIFKLLISVIITSYILAACRKDNGLPVPPGPGPSEIKLLEVKRTIFREYAEFMAMDQFLTGHYTITVDSTRRIISSWLLDGDRRYEQRHFDPSWRLTKIFRKSPLTGETDSIEISRTADGTVHLKRRGMEGDKLSTTVMPDGSRIILKSYNNGIRLDSFFINKEGLLVYADSEESNRKRTVTVSAYTHDGKLMSSLDSTFKANYEGSTARSRTFIKDNATNEHLLSFYKSMVGSDLHWILYTRLADISPMNFGDEHSPLSLFQNGTINSQQTAGKVSQDSLVYTPVTSPRDDIRFEPGYDARGRLTMINLKVGSVRVETTSFNYPD